MSGGLWRRTQVADRCRTKSFLPSISIARPFATVALIGFLCSRAAALDPALDASQFGHKSWKVRDGFVNGRVAAIAQTRDGYLWLGTPAGLYRFDGVRAVIFKPAESERFHEDIRSLLGSRDGSLWMGTRDHGLMSWKGGKLTKHRELEGRWVPSLAQGPDGTVWAVGWPTQRGSKNGLLCEFPLRGPARCQGHKGVFVDGPDQVLVDRQATVWVSSGDRLWRWGPGVPRAYSLKDSIVALAEEPGRPGSLLISTEVGMRRFSDGRDEPYVVAGPPPGPTGRLLGDRDGGLWIATYTRGLLRVRGGKGELFGDSDGLSGDWVYSLFEDREGDVWVGTSDGLDRLSDLTVASIGERQGLPNATVPSLLAARDGSVWFATFDGVGRLKSGDITVFKSPERNDIAAGEEGQPRKGSRVRINVDRGLPGSPISSLYEDSRGRLWAYSRNGLAYFQDGRFTSVSSEAPAWTNAIAEDETGLWISQRSGLLRLRNGKTERIPWKQLGRNDWATAMIRDPRGVGLWMGFSDGGVARVADGRVRELFTTRNGLGSGRVISLNLGSRGELWIATKGGLSRLKDGRAINLGSHNGLPCDAAHWSIQDNQSATWLYMPCGLVRITRADLDAWIADPRRRVSPLVLDPADGVPAETIASEATPIAAKTADGRIWFQPSDTLSVFDPARLKINRLPPPLQIEQIVADHRVYDASGRLELPPRVRDIQIDYTALSFVAPEKVQFRYRLEGRDEEWRDAGIRRQAFYTDLAPGEYRFHVIAANNSGVWNRQGAVLQFSIARAWWQTQWFYALASAAAALLLWSAYRLRIRKLEQEAARERTLQERQRELEKELAHASRMATTGQLTASISHEIRQPLAAVLVRAEAGKRWLKQHNFDEVGAAFDAIAKSAARAGDIVAGLRDLAKKEDPHLDQIDLNRTVSEIAVLAAGEAKAAAVTLAMELADGLPQVRAHKIRLQQVVLNLIVNAIQAIGGTDGPREVIVRTSLGAHGFVSVSVEDTGPGMNSVQASHAFEPFYTTKPNGLGIGLAICRSIIEAHDGTITIEPNTPRGLIVRFNLPVANAGAGESGERRKRRPSRQSTADTAGTETV